jgi:hypothetical protein
VLSTAELIRRVASRPMVAKHLLLKLPNVTSCLRPHTYTSCAYVDDCTPFIIRRPHNAIRCNIIADDLDCVNITTLHSFAESAGFFCRLVNIARRKISPAFLATQNQYRDYKNNAFCLRGKIEKTDLDPNSKKVLITTFVYSFRHDLQQRSP